MGVAAVGGGSGWGWQRLGVAYPLPRATSRAGRHVQCRLPPTKGGGAVLRARRGCAACEASLRCAAASLCCAAASLCCAAAGLCCAAASLCCAEAGLCCAAASLCCAAASLCCAAAGLRCAEAGLCSAAYLPHLDCLVVGGQEQLASHRALAPPDARDFLLDLEGPEVVELGLVALPPHAQARTHTRIHARARAITRTHTRRERERENGRDPSNPPTRFASTRLPPAAEGHGSGERCAAKRRLAVQLLRLLRPRSFAMQCRVRGVWRLRAHAPGTQSESCREPPRCRPLPSTRCRHRRRAVSGAGDRWRPTLRPPPRRLSTHRGHAHSPPRRAGARRRPSRAARRSVPTPCGTPGARR